MLSSYDRFMYSSHIVSLLIEERGKLNAAISALGGEVPSAPKKRLGRPPAAKIVDPLENAPEWVTGKTSEPTPKKRTMSAASRRRMAEGQKKRWAAINAAKGEAAAPRSVKIAEAIAHTPEESDFRKRMSETMKKAWAKRKAATKKKGGK